MRSKLRGDFQLTLTIAFAVVTMLGIAPFAVYRYTHGQALVGLLDTAIMLAIGLGAAQAYRSGKAEAMALLIAATCSIGCAAVSALVGLAGLLWAFPVLLANFLLVPRRQAAALSLALTAGVLLFDPVLGSVMLKAAFAVTAAVVGLFAGIFAWRAESQRVQLEAMAAHDPLTGAHNRRNMAAELKAAMAASVRDGTPLGLLIFDLDRFKSINDSMGHEAGDRVLVQVSELVRRNTRKQDRFFRLGGEEFGLLLPGADAQSLQHIAEKLRRTVEAEVRCGDHGVSISLGAASYCPGESAGSWQRRADLAMYRAKRDGRNRTVFDGDCGHVAAPVDGARQPATP
jgi:diguanylate cyclase (GGDEF)-like protein